MAERETTRRVLQEVVLASIGQCNHMNAYSRCMFALIQKVWRNHEFLMRVDATNLESLPALARLADSVFSDRVTWWRIAMYLAVVTHVTRYKPRNAHLYIDFLQKYFDARLNAWINERGWNNFFIMHAEVSMPILCLTLLLLFALKV